MNINNDTRVARSLTAARDASANAKTSAITAAKIAAIASRASDILETTAELDYNATLTDHKPTTRRITTARTAVVSCTAAVKDAVAKAATALAAADVAAALAIRAQNIAFAKGDIADKAKAITEITDKAKAAAAEADKAARATFDVFWHVDDEATRTAIVRAACT